MTLLVGGKAVPCAVPVLDWNQTGMETKVGQGARPRNIKKTPIDLFVLHWTGGEGGAEKCFQVLNQRDLGVEFAIEADGDVYQFADPITVDTFDAGPFNPRSIGVEISNYGFRDNPKEIPNQGKGRPLYQTKIRGKTRSLAAFWPEQLRSAVALVDALTSVIPTLPRNLPGTADGGLFTGTFTRAQAAKYRGICGHFHLSDNKSDPGTDILEVFRASGRYPLLRVEP